MAFSSLESAEGTLKARVANGTYIDAFACRKADGTIVIRALIPVVKGFGNLAGYPAATVDTVGALIDGGWNEYTT